MTANSLQIFTYATLAASAALLMALSGLQKKMLRRKEAPARCRTCGRTDRYNCPCSR